MPVNWTELCKIGRDCQALAVLLATKARDGSPEARRLRNAFPECFSDTRVYGPIPLSVLRDESGSTQDLYQPVNALREHDIPHALYYLHKPYLGECTWRRRKEDVGVVGTPEQLPPKLMIMFKEVFEHGGKKWVIVRDAPNETHRVCIAPLDYIDLDA